MVAVEETSAAADQPRVLYQVFVKLVKLDENIIPPLPHSLNFYLLGKTVSNVFNRAFEKRPGFHRMSFSEFEE